MSENKPFRFSDGEVLLIDKPLHWTSFDAVNKIRYKIRHAFRIHKIKVGHAGTLDPLASGLLIICTGKETKNIDQYQGQEKEYTGTFELGRETPSYDLETETSETHPIDQLSSTQIYSAAKSFIGKQEQMPPRFSAKKIDGKRAYTYARNQEEVVMKTREVEIKTFEITNIRMPFIDFKVVCSKGTYIRSLAHDFGKKLNNGACLIALRRTRIGNFSIDDAYLIDELFHAIEEQKAAKKYDGIIFDFNRTLYDPEKEKLMEGTIKLLNTLKKRGVIMALLSKTTTSDRRQLIRSLGLDDYFTKVVLTSGTKNESHFTEMMEAMQVSANRCVVVGDRVKSEITIGKKLGLQTIWLRRGKFRKEVADSPKEQPDHIINNLHEIYSLL